MFLFFFFFFFIVTATTEIYTLSLHDALPIFSFFMRFFSLLILFLPTLFSADRKLDFTTLEGKVLFGYQGWFDCPSEPGKRDRKSTRLNSSHSSISYAVFCLKKKKTTIFNTVH